MLIRHEVNVQGVADYFYLWCITFWTVQRAVGLQVYEFSPVPQSLDTAIWVSSQIIPNHNCTHENKRESLKICIYTDCIRRKVGRLENVHLVCPHWMRPKITHIYMNGNWDWSPQHRQWTSGASAYPATNPTVDKKIWILTWNLPQIQKLTSYSLPLQVIYVNIDILRVMYYFTSLHVRGLAWQ